MRYLLIVFLFTASLVSGYRLPKNVLPESYRLEIITPFGEEGNFEYEGTVLIETSCVQTTSNITLHSKDLTIDENAVSIRDATSKVSKAVKGLKITYEKDHDFLIIHLNEPLIEDHRYEIYIPFKGILNDGLAGFYRSSYIDSVTKKVKWLGVTQFEAISARRAFPCFDEPAMKATFDINIARKDGYTSVSNMPLILTEPMENKPGWSWDRFDISVPMSTYLVAWLVSDFEAKESKHEFNNVTFKIWSRKDALDQVVFAGEVGPKALHFFENFFNIDYPLPKQDMVAIPDFASGAMENWGLITYREAYLLYDPKISTKTNQHSVASVISHELAHQWFGNLVTMDWWTDLWLNEGFATYMASLAVHNLFPEWNSLEEEGANAMLAVFSFDSLKSSHPVSVPIGDPKEIDEIFDTISYKKGSSILRMMSLFLGEDTLRTGVSNYLREHRYHNAEQDDLWSSLTEAAHKNQVLPENLTVKQIMDTWTLQTGFPVIHVKRNYDDGSAEISQERFLRDTIKLKDIPNPCWWVPLTYSTKSAQNFNVTTPKYWLSCTTKSKVIDNIADKHDWVIFNNKMSGIYKVNYDEDNWHMLGGALKEDFKQIPTINRAQLLTDAADLAYIGDLPYDVVFNLWGYLENETEYLPIKTALENSDTLNTHLQFNSEYGLFVGYMKALLAPMYKRIGGLEMNPDQAEKLDKVKMQTRIAGKSCRYGVQECVDDALTLFKKLQANPDGPNPIQKDLTSIVYCTALRHGGEKEWNFLWEKYLKSNVASEKNRILGVLGCTKEAWLLNRYLEWSLEDSKIRRQDCSTVFTSVVSSDIGYYVGKKFFYKNINKLDKYLSGTKRRLGRYLTTLASRMQDNQDLEELENFIKEHDKIFSEVKKSVEQTLETVKIHTQWQAKHGQEIHKVLNKYQKKST
ncbi:aminopeptidase N-like [Anthonomus grandis grandis]|uniref:aminopeptidase N-like n=1 Tax=Anthonomus grandis grandis TaxID=2921223 RepID=UPI0021666C73|nr:aminopeptidase N-like [Anthonomus grandis grandis]